MTWNNNIVIAAGVFFLLITAHAGAKEQTKTAKIPIAVIDLKTNNCPGPYGRALAEMISGKLFRSEMFVLMERSQIDIVLREKGFQNRKAVDADYAADIGRVLAVQKMVVGSVSKFKNYKVEVRVVNVADNKVEMSLSRDIPGTGEFDAAANGIAQKIEDHYAGRSDYTGKYDLVVTAGIAHPLGDLEIVSDAGLGLLVSFSVNNFYSINRFNVIMQTGVYRYIPVEEHVRYMYSLPLMVYGGYCFDLSRYVSVVPALGAGYQFSVVRRDRIKERTYGESEYRTYVYYNPVLSITTEVDFLVAHRCYLAVVPKYAVFFESDKLGQFIGLDLGVRMLF